MGCEHGYSQSPREYWGNSFRVPKKSWNNFNAPAHEAKWRRCDSGEINRKRRKDQSRSGVSQNESQGGERVIITKARSLDKSMSAISKSAIWQLSFCTKKNKKYWRRFTTFCTMPLHNHLMIGLKTILVPVGIQQRKQQKHWGLHGADKLPGDIRTQNQRGEGTWRNNIKCWHLNSSDSVTKARNKSDGENLSKGLWSKQWNSFRRKQFGRSRKWRGGGGWKEENFQKEGKEKDRGP